jgi:phenylalanyl-tRNA synthetase alpha chain
MIQQLSSLQTQILEQLPTFSTGDALIEYRNKILGKNGELTVILKGLKDLTPEERGTVGKYANELRDIITEAFEAEKKRIQQDDIKLRLESEWKDMTIPYPLEI